MLEDNAIWTTKGRSAADRGRSQEKPKQNLDFMRKKGAAGPDSNGDADSWPGLVHPRLKDRRRLSQPPQIISIVLNLRNYPSNEP